MASPYPNLRPHPNSNLTFVWGEWHPGGLRQNGDMSFGVDGAAAALTVLVQWADLPKAITEILGYSWRDDSTTTPNGSHWLRRVLPWQHPYFNQLWADRISKVEGLRLKGTNETNPDDIFPVGEGGAGPDYSPNLGPWSEWDCAALTVTFVRPPYFLKTDAGVLDSDGNPQEWTRFVDKTWSTAGQMLAREGGTFAYGAGQGAASGTPFQGSVGQYVTHTKVSRTWYQVPEAALFEFIGDLPIGNAPNLLYMRTPTTNPATGYLIPASGTVGDPGYQAYPILGCVNSPNDGSLDDSDPDLCFFGCFMGTLRLDNIEVVTRPLHLPAYLMNVPMFADMTAISQVQYNVVFHFDLFDPPRAPSVAVNEALLTTGAVTNQAYRGHNLVPRSADGLWYGCQSQGSAGGTGTKTTPFQYAVFPDLFRIL